MTARTIEPTTWTWDEEASLQNRRPRVSTCARCGAPTTATGRRGPVPSTCIACKRRRSAALYVRAAARIAEDMSLGRTARELRQLAAHLEQH